MDVKDFETLKKQITEAKTRKDKLSGGLEQLKEQMKKEFDCNSVEELETLLVNTTEELETVQARFDQSLQELNELVKPMLN